MRNLGFSLAIFLIVGSCAPPDHTEETAFDGEWVDLTHPFNEETLHWPTAEPFQLDTVFAGHTDDNYYYEAHSFSSEEHVGTHLDAPIHFYEDRKRAHEIPVDQLIGNAVVIDVQQQVENDRDYRITVEDITSWEEQYGQIPDESILLFRTGFDQYWPDAEQYMGTAETGEEALADLSFPGIHHEAAEWLVENRNIKAVGLDTASLDYGQSVEFKSHVIFHEQNIPGFENIANLEQLPATGAKVVALPMNIEDGSGGPLRIVALLP